jgi:NAD(P)-dependent dehydrogenase (short-subunit alcohol dehydrogenase family)
MNRLAGKVALVTGGGSGMGRATVEKFVEEGAHVVIADIQEDKGARLAAELGPATCFVAADVCDEADVAAAVRAAVDHFGRLDCIFNNAGFGGVGGDIEATDMGEPWHRTVDAMLKGVVMGMKYAVPVMKAQGGGVILSTASVAGTCGGFGPHVYSAVKSAVINLTRSVALELGPHNIRVNAICPGGIATPIFAGQLAVKSNEDYAAAVRPALAMMQPIPRSGEPRDIANAACFLASDEASFISGHALIVDGGLTAGHWVHPDAGPGAIDALASLVGVEKYSDIDCVYHARR